VTGPSQDAPELLTSFGDFQRIYGGLDDLVVDSGGAVRLNHLAHAVRSYFDNGGGRLYAMRVVPDDATAATSPYLVGTGGRCSGCSFGADLSEVGLECEHDHLSFRDGPHGG
jgi:hypothetical protein